MPETSIPLQRRFGKWPSEKRNRLCQKRADNWLANRYWAEVYLNLVQRFPDDGISNFWIGYEDLVSGPIEWTGKLFRFLGSERSDGTDSYPPPMGYDWKWGTDDGGEKIKSLKVQASRIPQSSLDILDRVRNLPSVIKAREKLGYAAS